VGCNVESVGQRWKKGMFVYHCSFHRNTKLRLRKTRNVTKQRKRNTFLLLQARRAITATMKPPPRKERESQRPKRTPTSPRCRCRLTCTLPTTSDPPFEKSILI